MFINAQQKKAGIGQTRWIEYLLLGSLPFPGQLFCTWSRSLHDLWISQDSSASLWVAHCHKIAASWKFVCWFREERENKRGLWCMGWRSENCDTQCFKAFAKRLNIPWSLSCRPASTCSLSLGQPFPLAVRKFTHNEKQCELPWLLQFDKIWQTTKESIKAQLPLCWRVCSCKICSARPDAFWGTQWSKREKHFHVITANPDEKKTKFFRSTLTNQYSKFATEQFLTTLNADPELPVLCLDWRLNSNLAHLLHKRLSTLGQVWYSHSEIRNVACTSIQLAPPISQYSTRTATLNRRKRPAVRWQCAYVRGCVCVPVCVLCRGWGSLARRQWRGGKRDSITAPPRRTLCRSSNRSSFLQSTDNRSGCSLRVSSLMILLRQSTTSDLWKTTKFKTEQNTREEVICTFSFELLSVVNSCHIRSGPWTGHQSKGTDMSHRQSMNECNSAAANQLDPQERRTSFMMIAFGTERRLPSLSIKSAPIGRNRIWQTLTRFWDIATVLTLLRETLPVSIVDAKYKCTNYSPKTLHKKTLPLWVLLWAWPMSMEMHRTSTKMSKEADTRTVESCLVSGNFPASIGIDLQTCWMTPHPTWQQYVKKAQSKSCKSSTFLSEAEKMLVLQRNFVSLVLTSSWHGFWTCFVNKSLLVLTILQSARAGWLHTMAREKQHNSAMHDFIGWNRARLQTGGGGAVPNCMSQKPSR